jgi:hypothetical protein
VERFLRASVIGVVPAFGGRHEAPAGGPARTPGEPDRRDGPAVAGLEAYRALRTNIQFAGLDQRACIVVTSATAGEARRPPSPTSAPCPPRPARACPRRLRSLRRPSLHRIFRPRQCPRLTTALLEARRRWRTWRADARPNLFLVTSGPLPRIPPSSSEASECASCSTRARRLRPRRVRQPPVIAVSDGRASPRSATA